MPQEDPAGLLLGGIVGSGSLLLAWSIVQLGHALSGLTSLLKSGVEVTVVHTGDMERDRKG